MRPTEKVVVYMSILIVMVLLAISEETRNGGTPAQWGIFWIIVSLLGLGILRNIGAPEVPPRRTRTHHRRATRRDYKEFRRGK